MHEKPRERWDMYVVGTHVYVDANMYDIGDLLCVLSSAAPSSPLVSWRGD